MKNKTLQKSIFQGFIFNIIIFILFLFIGLNYLYPEFLEIEDKKNKLINIEKKYSEIKEK
jgi:F0F1-type ATP synthase membrane subunit b/b'